MPESEYPGLSSGSAIVLFVIMIVSMVSCNTLTDIDEKLGTLNENLMHQHVTVK